MTLITPIRPAQEDEAKRLIYTVAHGLFHPEGSLDDVIADWEARGTLADLEDIAGNSFHNGGTFLVTIEDDRVIGTGALRRFASEAEIGELKRLWLLPTYQGKGLGYQMVMKLFQVACEQGYHFIRLETDRESQSRALAFTRRLGFYEIPRYGMDPDSVAMEILLKDRWFRKIRTAKEQKFIDSY